MLLRVYIDDSADKRQEKGVIVNHQNYNNSFRGTPPQSLQAPSSMTY